MITNSPSLLVCDTPGLVLEELLPGLEELGCRCTYVEAPSELTASSADPDVIVLSGDIQGGAHGDELSRVKSLFPGVPLLVVARVRSLSAAIDFFRSGLTDYIPAPVSYEELEERIAVALKGRGGEQPVEVSVDYVPGPDNGEVADTGGAGIVDTLPCGVVILDSAGGLQHANSSALSMLGYHDPEALSGALADPTSQFQPIDMAGHTLNARGWVLNKALKEKAMRSATLSLKRGDRGRIWVRIDAMPCVERGQVKSVTVTLVNITEECSELKRLRENHGM